MGDAGVDQLIVVSKDVARQLHRWHVTLQIEGRLYHSARTYVTALIDTAVAAEADQLREKGCDVRIR
jgi:hypothetical protein